MLSARRSLVRARAAADGAVIAVDRDDLRTLVQRDSELSEILMRAFILRRVALAAQDSNDMVLLGSRHSGSTQHIKEFLSRNGQPFTYQDVETDPGVQVRARSLPHRRRRGAGDPVPRRPRPQEPVARDRCRRCWACPPTLDRAGGARRRDRRRRARPGWPPRSTPRPRGWTCWSSRPPRRAVRRAQSSRIENYLGFPTGISGEALAGRALTQAEKFGAEVAIGRTVARLDCDSRPYRLYLSDGQVVRTRAIVIATGVKYRKLDLPSLARFEGAGVFYSATHLEGQLCEGEEIAIVGGGNSAGQAAVFLSGVAARVHMLVRGPGLAESMSRYLIQRIESTPNIELRTRTPDRGAGGGQRPRAGAVAAGRHRRAGDARRSATCS